MARPAPMTGRDRGDADPAEVKAIADLHLPDQARPARDPTPEAARDDQQRPTPQRADRCPMEVVGVAVRDHDGVDCPKLVRIWCGSQPPQRPEPSTKDWIGHDSDAVELDKYGRMTEIGQPQVAAILPQGRCSRSKPNGARQSSRARSARARGTQTRVNNAPTNAPTNPSARSAMVSS